MRVRTWTMLAVITAASLAACSKPAAPPAAPSATASAAPPAAPASPTSAEVPHRKAGLWRQTMTMEGMSQAMPATEICLDDAAQAKLSMIGRGMGKGRCDPPQFARNPDGSFNFTANCDMGPDGRSVTTGTFTGDFNSSYKGVIDTKMTGGPAAANGDHRMTIAAEWVGPCAPDQKPGDMIMPGGMKMNMLNRPGG